MLNQGNLLESEESEKCLENIETGKCLESSLFEFENESKFFRKKQLIVKSFDKENFQMFDKIHEKRIYPYSKLKDFRNRNLISFVYRTQFSKKFLMKTFPLEDSNILQSKFSSIVLKVRMFTCDGVNTAEEFFKKRKRIKEIYNDRNLFLVEYHFQIIDEFPICFKNIHRLIGSKIVRKKTVVFFSPNYGNNLDFYFGKNESSAKPKGKDRILQEMKFFRKFSIPIAIQVLEGIVHLKKRKFVHRDIHSGNLAIGMNSQKIQVLITDFETLEESNRCNRILLPKEAKTKSLTKILRSNLLVFGNFVGSRFYRPNELFHPKIVKIYDKEYLQFNYNKSDVFSVGLILYKMLFRAINPPHFFNLHANPFSNWKQRVMKNYTPLPSIHSELANIVKRMCDPEYEKRIDSFKSLELLSVFHQKNKSIFKEKK